MGWQQLWALSPWQGGGAVVPHCEEAAGSVPAGHCEISVSHPTRTRCVLPFCPVPPQLLSLPCTNLHTPPVLSGQFVLYSITVK